MSRWVFIAVLMVGCSESAPSPESADLEAQVNSLLRRAQVGGGDDQTLFVPELSPEGFPLSVEAGTEVGALRGLRMVDGRLLVDVLARTRQQDYGFTLWLERRDAQWLIAGWRPTMTRLSSTTIDRFRPTDVPVLFAAPSLRRAPKAVVVPRTRIKLQADASSRAVHDWLVVRTRIRDVRKECKDRRAISRQLKQFRASVRECHERAFPKRKSARGRIILSVADAGVELRESTIISDSLTRCLTGAAPKGAPGTGDCSYTLDVLLSTTSREAD